MNSFIKVCSSCAFVIVIVINLCLASPAKATVVCAEVFTNLKTQIKTTKSVEEVSVNVTESVISLAQHRLSRERKQNSYMYPATDGEYVAELEPYARKVLYKLVQMIQADSQPTFQEYSSLHKSVWAAVFVMQVIRVGYQPEVYEKSRRDFFLLYSVYTNPEMNRIIEHWGFKRLEFEKLARSYIVQNMPERGLTDLIEAAETDLYFGIGDLKDYTSPVENGLVLMEARLNRLSSEYHDGFNFMKTHNMRDLSKLLDEALLAFHFLRLRAGDRFEKLSPMQFAEVQELFQGLLALETHPVFKKIVYESLLSKLRYHAYARRVLKTDNREIQKSNFERSIYVGIQNQVFEKFKQLKKDMAKYFSTNQRDV